MKRWEIIYDYELFIWVFFFSCMHLWFPDVNFNSCEFNMQGFLQAQPPWGQSPPPPPPVLNFVYFFVCVATTVLRLLFFLRILHTFHDHDHMYLIFITYWKIINSCNTIDLYMYTCINVRTSPPPPPYKSYVYTGVGSRSSSTPTHPMIAEARN